MKKSLCILFLLFLMATSGCATANYAGQAAEPIESLTEVMAGDIKSVPEYAYDPSSRSQLSSFTTKYSTKSRNRASNVQRAASSIDGAIIRPGETFSFNETTGPTTRNNGYKLATVFFNKEESKGYGGGVCQVSTTLYNAAEMAGMEITERHTHSREVTYIEKGRDATVSRKGNLDLKIKNNKPYSVIIRTANYDGTLTVEFRTL